LFDWSFKKEEPKMVKCDKHGCEMVLVKLGVGWGNPSEYECPECKKEKAAAGAVFSQPKAGWQ